ncbi:hypothetical protein F511_42439 [Dorcoceras hygrometricum]|uniref:Uncharacterized protein n=1 Tax=Dorcoceras hygrometricum TaxID=472368 RepID=A0A2Z7BIE3_9LAMI|nr:hypothetical protein F511_42439 [Dorcoceras hygrometricum]
MQNCIKIYYNNRVHIEFKKFLSPFWFALSWPLLRAVQISLLLLSSALELIFPALELVRARLFITLSRSLH